MERIRFHMPATMEKSNLTRLLPRFFILLTIFLSAVTCSALADTESVTLTPSFPNGGTASSYTVGKTYIQTVNITAASLEEPVLVISIPKDITLSYYPDKSDPTLSPDLATIATPVYTSTDTDGSTLLTYHFRANKAAVGFSFNLTPNYKLRHGGTYTVTARLYNGSELNNSTDSGIVVDNPTVRSGVYSPYIASKNVNLSDGGADYITDLVSIVNSSKNNYLYRNYVYHYAYDALKIALPLPANATPGYYAGADFVTMAPEDTRELSDGTTITYHENYAYVNAGGTTLGSGKALVYTLPAESPYAAGTTSVSILYLDSDVLGHMYLSFPGSTAAGTYSAAYSLQVSAAIDGTDTVLYDYQTYYLLSFIFKEYNPGDYFNHTLTYTSDVYNTGNYLVNMENAASFLDQFNNTTGETMEDITVEYTVPADMYLNKVRCGLSASTSSPLPSTATVVYRLNGESTDYTKVLTADEISFSLTNPSDAITHMEVTFDKLGTCTYQNLLFGSIVNRGNRETGTGSVYSRIISSHGSDTIGEYAESASRSYTFYYRTSYDSLYPYLLASTSALNKGDTFNIRFAGAASAAQLTNPRFYILMPSEFIFVSYTPASNCADSPYELTTKSVTVTPAQAGANMPAGGYTLYTIKYEGDYLASTGYYHYMYFKVGPTVDTASVRTLNLPAVYAATSDNALFKYRADTASYRFTDVWDFDEDGDTAEVLAKPSSLPLITINAVSTLTAQAFLTSSSANGESVSQSFQYNATGSYKLYLYNGYGTGESASGCAFDISIPRDGTGVTYNGITYTSSWNAILTGPPQLSGGFLAGADVLYSTDGGESYSSDTPEDYGAVTNLRIATAPDLTLGSRESIVITLPIEADYEDDVTASSKAYFGAGLSFKLSSSGDEVYATAIEPCAMQTQTVSITGSVFKDYNGNGVQDATEQANNKSYSVSLYKISGSTQTLISTYTTNVSTGAYTAGILLPGDYKLKVAIGAGEYYPVVTAESLFNENGEYFFTAGGPEPPQLTGVNLGVVSPRTLSVNFSSVTLIEGTPRKIVVTAYPALFGDEAVTFLSSDETVVTVAADGTLTYAGDGTAQITVTVPQLSGYVAAVPGADPTLTTTVNVTCQRPGCHVTADPYITKTPGIATAITSDMVLYSPTSQYTGYYYYYFNRGGYCNDPAHTQTTSVTWEIVSAGTTGAAIYTSSSGSGSLYGHIRLSYTSPGTLTLRATETWTHDPADAPDPILLTITIKGQVAKPSVTGSLTYNGAAQTAGIAPNSLYTITGNTQTAAGSYTATVSLNDSTVYQWADGTNADLSLSWSIARRAITITAASGTKDFDGTPLTNSASSITSGSLVTGHSHTAAVTGTITNAGSVGNVPSAAVIRDAGGNDVTANYEVTYGNGTLTVSRISNPFTVDCADIVYESEPAPQVSGAAESAGITYYYKPSAAADSAYTTTKPLAAGAYTVKAVSAQTANYSETAKTTAFSISPMELEKPAVTGSLTYNGAAQTAGIASNTRYTVSGNTQTSAGSYTATVSLNDKINYRWSDGTTSNLSLSWSIAKREITITAASGTKDFDGTPLTNSSSSVTSGSLVTGHSHTATVTGTITNAGSVGNVPSAAVIKDAGSNTVTANYEISYQNGTLTINKVAQSALAVTGKPDTVTYGDTFTLAVSGGSGSGAVTWQVSSGSSATVGTDGSVTVIGVGETTVTAVKAADGNHTAAVSATYTFTPLKKRLTVGAPSVTAAKVYDGTVEAHAAPGSLTNIVGDDDVTVSISGCSYNDRTIATGKTITVSYGIGGGDALFYLAPENNTIVGSITAPVVTTAPPTGIGTDTAVLNAGLSVPASYIEAGFLLRTAADAEYASYTVLPESATAISSFALNLSLVDGLTLAPDTEYRFKAYVKVDGVTYEGGVLSFRTAAERTAAGTIRATLNNSGAEEKTVTASIETGSTILSTTVRTVPAGGSDTAEFAGVADGVYNLVVRCGTWIQTTVVTVSGGSLEAYTFTILDGTRNTLVQVGEDAPNIAAGGMSSLFGSTVGDGDKGVTNSDLAAGNSVQIVVVSQQPDITDTDVQTGQSSLNQTAGAQGGSLVYVDLSLLKTVTTSTGTSNTTNLTESPVTIEIVIPIPDELKNKTNYTVYRYHNGSSEKLNKLAQRQDVTDAVPDEEGFYVNEASGYIFVYTRRFSLYAIGFSEPVQDTAASTITATASEGGSILPRSAVVELGGNKTFTIVPDEGYRISDVLVDGQSVGAVGSYTFRNVRIGHTIRAIFEEAAAENPFEDVSGGDWYYDAVMYMYRSGLMDGVSDTAFGPGLTTTRAMLATVLWRLEGCPSASGGAPFGDVSEGKWYTEAVDWASENGIVLGLGGETFGPDINITREQAAAMLYRYAAYRGCDLTADADLNVFSDADAASPYAVTNINWAVARGIISGITETALAPGGEATRAQIALIVYRFIGYAA